MLNIEPTATAEINTKTSSNNSDKEEADNGNPVWEEISPLIWRDAIYSDAVKDTMMGKLFADEITLFQETLADIKKDYQKVALVEVGMGTAEL